MWWCSVVVWWCSVVVLCSGVVWWCSVVVWWCSVVVFCGRFVEKKGLMLIIQLFLYNLKGLHSPVQNEKYSLT